MPASERDDPATLTLQHGRRLTVYPDSQQAVDAAVNHFIDSARDAIARRGAFYVALSGGTTPKAIYQELCSDSRRDAVDWSKVFFGWSDERCVHPDDPSSNYRMAMDAGLGRLAIAEARLWRMPAEKEPPLAAREYSDLLRRSLPALTFDLVMLGMGDDGHTASLFPYSEALHEALEPAAANWVEKLGCWRLTLTYPCINRARHIALYVIGEGKAETLQRVLEGPHRPEELPVQAVGSTVHPTLWFVDRPAARLLAHDGGFSY